MYSKVLRAPEPRALPHSPLQHLAPTAVTAVDFGRSLPNRIRRAPRRIAHEARLAGKEAITLAAHVAIYPAGITSDASPINDPRHRIDSLPPVERGLIVGDIAASGTPIVLIHGVVDNRSAFAVLRRTLRRRGYGRITTVNYSPWTANMQEAARQLSRHIELVCAQTGYEHVAIVGHSLGGLIARYYVQCLGGDSRVNTVVTLGSPHAGSHFARLVPARVIKQLRPGSEVMQELAAPSRCTTRFVAIYSDRDEFVLPNSNARIEHPDLDVRHYRVHGVGHLALLVDREVVHTVADALHEAEARKLGLERRLTPQKRSQRSLPAGED